MYRRTFAEINLDHIAHNFEALKQAFPQAPFLCPMVKANAYGHGDVAVARCLEQVGAKHLGVCLIEEGLLLRRGGVKAEILVFRGFDREGAEQMIQHNLTPVVASWDQLEAIQEVAKKAVGIHLKFNTGMNRLGFHPEEAQDLFEACWQNTKIRVQGILTHLYNGEDAADALGDSAEQLMGMEHVISVFKPLNPVVHTLNSSGILSHLAARAGKQTSHPLMRVNWGLRPGLMIYGYNPLNDPKLLPLKPAMTLKSVASTYRELSAGEVVSYGGTWTARKESVIAVVPIGYADGYHRILSNKAQVLFAGQRVPVVGNICMDFLMLDVTEAVKNKNLKDFKDQEIILFGQDHEGQVLSPEELAKHAQTITWEILTSVGERVPRVYTGSWAKKLGVEI
ncbi:alanine racemase [Bdellovibrio sp. HCB337]|uniref:alanine racemase n=1 Tax=Bdellovibrio sp. HCB337 TaxID=3394358 RepID=UPI0039A43561